MTNCGWRQNSSAPGCWNDWSRVSSGYVTQELGVVRAERYLLELHPSGSRAVGRHFGISLLSCRHLILINLKLRGDRVNHCAGECVCHTVVLASNVPDICCELRDIGQVTLLPWGPWFRILGKAEGEWLVVGVCHKCPTLKEIAEVAYCEVQAQQLTVESTVLLFRWP